jgi:hypothetical protein
MQRLYRRRVQELQDELERALAEDPEIDEEVSQSQYLS